MKPICEKITEKRQSEVVGISYVNMEVFRIFNVCGYISDIRNKIDIGLEFYIKGDQNDS